MLQGGGASKALIRLTECGAEAVKRVRRQKKPAQASKRAREKEREGDRARKGERERTFLRNERSHFVFALGAHTSFSIAMSHRRHYCHWQMAHIGGSSSIRIPVLLLSGARAKITMFQLRTSRRSWTIQQKSMDSFPSLLVEAQSSAMWISWKARRGRGSNFASSNERT